MHSRIAIVLGVLLSATLILACNSADKTSSNTSSRPTSSPAVSGQVPTIHADGIRRITTVELRDLLAKNEAVVIDVRNEASFAVGHIQGAKLIPHTDVVKHANELPKDKLIVTYCS